MDFQKQTKFIFCFVCLAALWSGCAEIKELQKPEPSPFYGKIAPPKQSEFRWSNGDAPKTFDPAMVSAPAEMQAARAMFEGLTDLDAKTLQPVAALAASWTATEDSRTWTFRLRPNAAWTNGKKITAPDFVRSWRRAAAIGEKSPHHALLKNVVGSIGIRNQELGIRNQELEVGIRENVPPLAVGVQMPSTNGEPPKINAQQPAAVNQPPNSSGEPQAAGDSENQKSKIKNPESWFGAEAVDDLTLRVTLVESDKDFPALAAHPIFRPISGDGAEFEKADAAAKIVSSGAFRLVSNDKNGALFERSKNYWNVDAVSLERVRFVPARDAEAALAAYQAGEVDAVTNAHFEPLALKLMASYKDFQKTTFNAVTFYEFSRTRPPFDNRKVREALTIAIDRERLTADEMDGASVPAHKFLPLSVKDIFKFDAERAKKLLAEAGFPNGKDFPKIKLLVNRNDAQRRLAKTVAEQWRKTLNVETEIVVSSLNDVDAARAAEDFDLVRRVVVLPTTSEATNLSAIFSRPDDKPAAENAPEAASDVLPLPLPTIEFPFEIKPDDAPVSPSPAPPTENANETKSDENPPGNQTETEVENPILTEEQAIAELPALPLYFPSSYILVKPYVSGFDANSLDAPSLKNVRIQMDWEQQK